jgi:hypothetical protein
MHLFPQTLAKAEVFVGAVYISHFSTFANGKMTSRNTYQLTRKYYEQARFILKYKRIPYQFL